MIIATRSPSLSLPRHNDERGYVTGSRRLAQNLAAQNTKFWHHARMSLKPLIESVQASLEHLPPGGIVVGFSGGMDSSVLLHALAQIPEVRERGLRALHVDHGLHAESTRWTQQCRAFAENLHVAHDVIAVDVKRDAGTGLEDAARRARRAAFALALASGEILALAHHRDDQAETILLKLLRGAGPEGLGGMRALRAFGSGSIWRPLLEHPRSALAEYAQQHSLRWIQDPSNANTHLRRNFLRAEILPRLSQRWPDASAALAHSATWARSTADLIHDQSIAALEKLRGPQTAMLRWRDWLALPDALRDPVLRYWLRDLGLDEPAHFHVIEIERQLRDAAPDKLPCVSWDGTEVRRYRDWLYAMRRTLPVAENWQIDWDGRALDLPAGGTLTLQSATRTNGAETVALQVRYRQGSERLKPAGKEHTRELRLLLQEAAVPPWLRDQVPLIYADGELIAVGDLFLSAAARDLCARLDVRIEWKH
jgi:tRNA(Ile)-lysidine synthase